MSIFSMASNVAWIVFATDLIDVNPDQRWNLFALSLAVVATVGWILWSAIPDTTDAVVQRSQRIGFLESKHKLGVADDPEEEDDGE
jgi:hypothetical protein